MTDQERNQLIVRKLNEGMSLSEVQTLLKQDYGVRMTYMELRLLVADLPVQWQAAAPRPAAPATAVAGTLEADDTPDEADADEDDLGAAPERTTITISKLVRPGAAISGDVTFASGARGEWFVDTMGRLGLNPAADSTRPTPDDIREFQIELQRQLSAMGG